MTEHSKTEIADGIMTLTLNRPEKLNAYTAQMGDEISYAFEQADLNDDVRVIVLTGAGRGFCAGADISAGADSFGDSGAKVFGGSETRKASKHFIDAIYSCTKPSISAINGAAVGVGLTMTLPTDIRIASDNAKLGFIFTRRGLVPEAGSAWFLPRLVGLPQALEWSLTGAMISPDEAKSGGLVNEVTKPEDLLTRAYEIARSIANNSAPVATAIARQLLWRFAGESSHHELLGLDAEINEQLGAGPDVKEGVQAFLEKRAPQFPGKVSSDLPAAYPWWSNTEFSPDS